MTNQYFLARLAGRDPNLRAGDADRELIADRLRKGHGDGRLDLSEFQERLERCYTAKTFGELDELVRDLPRETEPTRQPPSWLWPWRLLRWAPLLILLVIATGGHAHHFFWLWIPAAFIIWRLSWWRRRRPYAGRQRAPGGWI
jgi:hypothetical protein